MSTTTETKGTDRPAHLLVIDDDNLQRLVVREVASKVGYETTGAASYEEAAEQLGHHDYDCITLDISLGGRSGLDVLRLFNELRCRTPIIVISGSNQSVRDMANELGLNAKLDMRGSMSKPVNLLRLREVLEQIKNEALSKPAEKITYAGWTSSNEAA